MTNTHSILNQLAAESLLEGSFVLTQIETLRKSLATNSDGVAISYDDYYERLQKQLDEIDSLELKLSVGPGTENQYMVELISALDQISSDANRVSLKAYKFLSMLKNAQSEAKKLSGVFVAWYTIAATEFIAEKNIKLGAPIVKTLGESEFSRLLGGLDSALETLIVAVGIQVKQIEEHRKLQKEKFGYGQKQCDSNFLHSIPDFGGYGANPDGAIKKREPKEEPEVPEEGIPDYVSKKPSFIGGYTNVPALPHEPVITNGTWNNNVEISGTFVKQGTPQPVDLLLDADDSALEEDSADPLVEVVTETPMKSPFVDYYDDGYVEQVEAAKEIEQTIEDIAQLAGLVEEPTITTVNVDDIVMTPTIGADVVTDTVIITPDELEDLFDQGRVTPKVVEELKPVVTKNVLPKRKPLILDDDEVL
jgi:hypothetical protein